jgi:hypothetical protein
MPRIAAAGVREGFMSLVRALTRGCASAAIVAMIACAPRAAGMPHDETARTPPRPAPELYLVAPYAGDVSLELADEAGQVVARCTLQGLEARRFDGLARSPCAPRLPVTTMVRATLTSSLHATPFVRNVSLDGAVEISFFMPAEGPREVGVRRAYEPPAGVTLEIETITEYGSIEFRLENQSTRMLVGDSVSMAFDGVLEEWSEDASGWVTPARVRTICGLMLWPAGLPPPALGEGQSVRSGEPSSLGGPTLLSPGRYRYRVVPSDEETGRLYRVARIFDVTAERTVLVDGTVVGDLPGPDEASPSTRP